MKLFRPLTTKDLMARELEQARKSLLEALTAREYAESMCKYREAQIKRLMAYLHKPLRSSHEQTM